MKNTKRTLLMSAVSLLLCFTMLLGTTFAWFTAAVSSGGNVIQSGRLDAEMYWSNSLLDANSDQWQNADGATLFKSETIWEPGHTELRYIKVRNAGNLAFKWRISIEAEGAMTDLADVIDVYYISSPIENALTSLEGLTPAGNLTEVISNRTNTSGALLPKGTTEAGIDTYEVIIAVALNMQKTADNDYSGKSLGDGFRLKLVAAQYDYENDSFGKDYDNNPVWPESSPVPTTSITFKRPALDAAGCTTEAVSASNYDGSVSATIPAGTKLDPNAKELRLTVNEVSEPEANFTLADGEASKSLDVHLHGVAEDNEAVISVKIEKSFDPALNSGNHRIYHVEDGVTNGMTAISDGATAEHNSYVYDPVTGDVTMNIKSFSEMALVENTVNAWNGIPATAFAGGEGTEAKPYLVANADQFVYFGDLISNDNENYGDKHYKLLADINLGGEENANAGIIFYPVGYHKEGGTVAALEIDDTPETFYFDEDPDYARGTTSAASEETTKWYTYGGAFKGTFDGDGHKISNIYQNTWQLKGNYSGNYWNAAMGIFGYVVGGTVKNLSVDNFSSDGEFTPTGVIAAYATNSTFANIAITNCNPRVYNTGNGGIVGIGGNSDDPDTYKLTFTNITIDNSNKISALWGSWDVACGGLVGMFRGAGHVYMTNCHIGAQIDVYNDVCGNYQYYWYRYSGMMIGTNKNMITDDKGYTVPETTKFHAEKCTIHFGEWNDYYYCELVANSLASYTHDHQFSRLEEISSLDEIKSGDAWTKTGNFLLISGNTKTCYHIVNKNSTLTQHLHTDAGEETVNGETVLKEDKQIVYLPFNQLFTGYGWGVKHIPVYNGEDYAFEGITILDREAADSVEKFEGKVNELNNSKQYTLGDIFVFVNKGVDLVPGALTVTVTNLDENNPVSATIVYDRENWENSTITFTGTGEIQITIQDYYFCTPSTITVDVTERKPEVKFDVVLNNGDFLHRVGNSGTVALDKLFAAKKDVEVDTVSVTVEAVDDTGASGTYSNNAIQFNGTGVVKVTITDNDYCTPTELYLEVVDAVNATGAISATNSNVVLLNDIGSGFTVSGNYTVFGNGFTLNYTGNGQYLNNGLRQGIVNVSENGRLDNLRIKASIYPSSYLYYDEVKKGPNSVEGDKTRYHYQLSAVVAKDSATISNCYIYGGRNNIFVDTGNVTITDTVTECGTLANIQIQSTEASIVTLNNVTTIQYRVNATLGNTNQVMMGAGVIVGPDMETNPSIVLNGEFKQYNWVTAEDKEAVTNSTAQTIIQTALDATAFNHTVNNKNASNLGIIYLNNVDAKVTNNTGLPYEFGNVEMLNQDGKVYSPQSATESQIFSDYVNADRTTVNGDYIPTFEFDLGNQEISYDGSEDTRYLYGDANGIIALYKDGEEPLTLDLTKLATIYKYKGVPYGVTVVCKNSEGSVLAQNTGVVTLDTQVEYTIVFTVNDNIFYDKNGKTVDKSVTREYSVPLKLTVKAADIKNAVVNITKTALDGVYTKVNLTDYKLRVNFLDCISITDYDNKGTGTTVNLSENISSATLTPSSVNVFTTASTITVTYTDGRVLTVNLSKISGSSPGTKTATVNTSGGLYFITDGALNNKPTEATSQNKCTITSVSYKGNSGSTVTNDTDVTVTWELGSSGGTSPCVTPDTLVTLADGTQKEIQYVTYEDQLLVWDFYEGKYAVVPAAIIFDHGYGNNTVIKLSFSNGTSIKVVNMHQFFDATLNKMVTIDAADVQQYVGHEFIYQDGDGYSTVTLDTYTITNEYVEAWGIMSSLHYNIIVEGIFSADFDPADLGLFNYFEIGDDMMYDQEKMQADIEQYGLYTYEDFADYLTYEQFVAFNVQYFKIAVEKGNYTYEGILALIDEYLNQ